MLPAGLGNSRDLKQQERQQKETGKSQKGGASTAEGTEKDLRDMFHIFCPGAMVESTL
jgi:hypothetical protein